jgi:transcriptional regulator with XRE-family HTH domain
LSALRLRDADILLPRHRTARKERLRDTADRAGISPQYLSELERGMKDPSSEMLEAVAGALGKSSFELTRGAIRSWAPTSPCHDHRHRRGRPHVRCVSTLSTIP